MNTAPQNDFLGDVYSTRVITIHLCRVCLLELFFGGTSACRCLGTLIIILH
jgi:hypothetical protein